MRRKVIVTLPTAKSGGSNGASESNSNANPQWFNNSNGNDFSEPDITVNQSLKPVSVKDANLEAEKGETAFVPDESGIPALYKIGGKRHYDGGTPLDLPEDSFIFSRDKKMKIGGPILESFGKKKDTKDKFTPAELSNQYKINDFRKVLADPNTDKTQRDTAELMISNYNLKLAKLGLVQESTKGFPDGIPAIAMPYLEMIQVDPSQFVDPQGQGQNPNSQGMAQYGGLMKAQTGKGIPQPAPPKTNSFFQNHPQVAPIATGVATAAASEVLRKVVKMYGPSAVEWLRVPETMQYVKDLISEFGEAGYKMIGKSIGPLARVAGAGAIGYGVHEYLKDDPLPYYPTAKPVIKPKPKVQIIPPSIALPKQVDPYAEEEGEYVEEEEPVYNAPAPVNKFDTIKVAGANPYLTKKLGGDIPKYQRGGGIVTTYDDGTSSTKYTDGRIEIKDDKGNILQTIPGNPTAIDPDGKGIYKSSPGEVTPEGLDPSSIYTQEELVQRYKEQGIDYANMTDAEAQAALYQKADPFDKAYMWGQVGNTKAGLASGQEAKFSKYKPKVDKLGRRESLTDYKKRLGALGYTPESLNKELEPYGTSFADGFRGLREAWLLDPSKETSIASVTGKKEDITTAGPLSGGVGDEYFAPKPKWWLQDKIRTAGAFWDKLNIKKHNPWQAIPGYALEQGTFYDPTRELAASAEMVNQGVTGASTFSGPQGYAATASMLQGQGAKNNADIMGRYNNMNVSEANRLNGVNTGIMNQAAQQRANAATQLYDKQTVANQQFDNSKNLARQNLRQSFMDAITNRANTANLNTLYPQYAINPSNGGMAYNPQGSNRRPTKDGTTSQSVESYIDQLRKNQVSETDIDRILKYTYGKGQSDQSA